MDEENNNNYQIKPVTVCIGPRKHHHNKYNQGKVESIKLDGQIELKNECLKYFHGCWIKAIKKRTREFNSGGFLTKIEYGIAYLRPIQGDLIELQIDAYKFFVKEGNEQYIAMQQIELEKEKNKLHSRIIKQKTKELNESQSKYKADLTSFDNRKKEFERIRYKFFKLFQDGKVKITM